MNAQPNIEGLKELYLSNAAARAFLDHCAGRGKHQPATKVDCALGHLRRAGHNAPRENLIEVFHALTNLNCGQYVPERKSGPARFVWRVNMVDIARVAAGRPPRIKAIPGEMTPDETIDDILTNTFHLRPEIGDSFLLPTDLTESEAERLAGSSRTLPIDWE